MTDAWRSLEHPRLSVPPSRRHRAAARTRQGVPVPPPVRLHGGPDAPLHVSGQQLPATAAPARSARRSSIPTTRPSGTNSIDFDIPGTGVQTIEPASPLPAITNPVLIDGFSQPGYAGTPLIELNGSQAGAGDGLTITGAERHRARARRQQFQPGRGHPHHGHRGNQRLDLRQLPGHRSDRHDGRCQRIGSRDRRGSDQQPDRDQRRRRQRCRPSET